MLEAEAFLKTLVDKYGKHTVYSDGASCSPTDPSGLSMRSVGF